MTREIRITAVSYLNTVPFLYGIEHADNLRADLRLSPPSACAADFRDGQADLALVPVAAIPQLHEPRIVTDYCIGAVGSVRTVVLVSDVPLREIRNVYLDPHSLTSVQLVRILARELWRIDPAWHDPGDYARLENPAPHDAFLLIGDKVFAHERRFAYRIDLADAWRELTGLPFVFAVWLARPEVPQEVVDRLGRSLKFGVEHIPQAVEHYGHAAKPYAVDYLTRNIDFLFDAPKRRAFDLFREKCAACHVRSKPG